MFAGDSRSNSPGHPVFPSARPYMTDRHSRREFLGLAGAGAASSAAGILALPRGERARALFALLGSQRSDPDLIVFNAKVHTMDPATPRAQAFAISGSRFIAVGT